MPERINQEIAFQPLRIAILTVSDTRTLADDRSGNVLVERTTAAGHQIAVRDICQDDIPSLTNRLQTWIDNPDIDVILTTGGTGVTGRDVTPEALDQVAEKKIAGFGELFRWQSYQKIGTSTVQSRADAGVAKGTYIFVIPGSPGACRDAWDGILQHQLDIRHRPCNFAELIPRLREHEG